MRAVSTELKMRVKDNTHNCRLRKDWSRWDGTGTVRCRVPNPLRALCLALLVC